MPHITRIVMIAAAALLLGAARPQPDSAPPPALPTPAATLAPTAFLHATWLARVGDDILEERWSAPAGNTLTGMFRWIRPDGTARLYELLTITADEDAVTFRFRHFSAELVPWEPADAPITLRLVESGRDRLVFENVKGDASPRRLIYELTEPGALAVTLEGTDGERTTFTFHRSP